MRDQFELAQTTPHDEPCIQIGSEDYTRLARIEARAFINQLIRINGHPPGDAAFRITNNPHDFGTYLDVAIAFDDDNEEECDYAYLIERTTPNRWDEEAKKELAENGYKIEN